MSFSKDVKFEYTSVSRAVPEMRLLSELSSKSHFAFSKALDFKLDPLSISLPFNYF